MSAHTKPARSRLDLLLVERGLVPSREKARAAILAGLVSSAGVRLDKPGTLVRSDTEIAVAAGRRFVGRGGEKLEGLIGALGLGVTGAIALDVGSSTGGFTDCLLQHRAARVVALDVGRGQLDWKLRNDPRVMVVEGVNVRYLDPATIPAPFDLIVVDVSFISLRLVLPGLFPLLQRGTHLDGGDSSDRHAHEGEPVAAPGAPGELDSLGGARLPLLLALLKPQFEVGRGKVGRRGVVTDPQEQLAAVLAVASSPAALGLFRIIESSIRGAEGNREFFLCFGSGPGLTGGALEQNARAAVLP